MLIPDLNVWRRFVDIHQPAGRMLLCAVTGSHHYGFPSADSDLDLKGIHLAPTRDLLGLGEPIETQDRLEVFEDVECDYTSHEAKKALKLLLAGNGNMLERILSPYQLYETDDLAALQALARRSLSKRFFNHYRGYFNGMCAEHDRYADPGAKTLLYSYRTALTGAHLLRTGELEADLNTTAEIYGFMDIDRLIDFKRIHGEKSILPKTLNEHFKKRWSSLETILNEAIAQSPLPDASPNAVEISEWLIEKRIIIAGGK